VSERQGDPGTPGQDDWASATFRLWSDWASRWSEALGTGAAGDESTTDFVELLRSAVPEGGELDMNRLTDLGTTGAAAATAMLAWQAALARPIAEAAGAFAAELGGRAGRGEAIPDLRGALTDWNRILEQHLHAAMQAEDYTAAQARLLRTVMRHRLAQRAAMEPVLEHFDLPTRSELDQAYRTVHELRREVRELRRRLEAVEDALPAEPSPGAEAGGG